jgi:hypothetical protein
MYEKAIDAAKRILFYRPMTPNEDDILISAGVAIKSDSDFRLDPQGQHLVCSIDRMTCQLPGSWSRDAYGHIDKCPAA